MCECVCFGFPLPSIHLLPRNIRPWRYLSRKKKKIVKGEEKESSRGKPKRGETTTTAREGPYDPGFSSCSCILLHTTQATPTVAAIITAVIHHRAEGLRKARLGV